jgi:hypothetical protein
MEIQNFDELIEFIETNDLSIENISKLVKECIGVHIVFYTDKTELKNDLKTFWQQYKNTTERPIFLDAETPFDLKKFWNKRLK